MIEVVVAPKERKEELWKLFQEYADELAEYDGEKRLHGCHHYPCFDQYWTEPTRIPFVVIYDHEAIGFCLLHDIGICFRIDEFYIRPLHRRRGFGRKVVEYIKQYCIENGRHKILAANVYINNEPAIKFWLSAGFKDTGRRIRIKNLRLMETELIL